MSSIRNYVTRSITSFEADPADDDFQRGYLAALKDFEAEGIIPAEDAAVQIAEHAFRSGFEAARDQTWYDAWSDYDPPEDIKDLIP